MHTHIKPVAFQALIETLIRNEATFALIGGVALILQGSSRSTQDLDICYARNDRNYVRLAAALEPWHVRLRDAPENLPFHLDAATLRRGLNFTFDTELGALDLFGEVPGLGYFETLSQYCESMDLFGHSVLTLTLEGLERAKLASGRLKDSLDIDEIRKIQKLKS